MDALEGFGITRGRPQFEAMKGGLTVSGFSFRCATPWSYVGVVGQALASRASLAQGRAVFSKRETDDFSAWSNRLFKGPARSVSFGATVVHIINILVGGLFLFTPAWAPAPSSVPGVAALSGFTGPAARLLPLAGCNLLILPRVLLSHSCHFPLGTSPLVFCVEYFVSRTISFRI